MATSAVRVSRCSMEGAYDNITFHLSFTFTNYCSYKDVTRRKKFLGPAGLDRILSQNHVENVSGRTA